MEGREGTIDEIILSFSTVSVVRMMDDWGLIAVSKNGRVIFLGFRIGNDVSDKVA